MELEEMEGNLHCTDYEYIKTSPYKGHVRHSEQRNLYEIIKAELKEYGMKNNETTHILLMETNYIHRRKPHSVQYPVV